MSAVGMLGFTETEIGWIPTDWSIQSVASMANVDSESLSNKTAADFTFRYISLGDVDAGKLIGGHSLITFAEAPSRARRIVKSGDILFATVRPNLKGHFFARRVDGNVVASTGFAVIRAKAGVASPAFLYQSLLSGSVDAQIEKLTVGSNYPAVNSADVKGLLLPAPPLPEQQKIAAILTAVDDKLDVIARQIGATQTLKQGLMQTLFSRGVGTQDADGRWVPHAEFKDSELGEIPVGWDVTTVGEVCKVKGGKRLPKGEVLTEENTGFPYIRVTDMYMGGVNTEGVLYVPAHVQPSIARYTISKDDIFISVAGTLGLVGVVPEELDGANLTENADKLTDIKICRDYLFYCLCSDAIQGAIAREGTSNAQPKLALSRIREFSIPLPTRPEQERIAAILNSVSDKLASLQSKLAHYQALKRGLMQKLLTGEWRVNVDPSATGM